MGAEPSAWTRDDAVVAAAHWAAFCSILAPGFDVVFAEAGVAFMDWISAWMVSNPYIRADLQPAGRHLPLALLCLDLMRSEADTQPEGIIAGAGGVLCQITQNKSPSGKAAWEAGFLEIFKASMARYNPIERISSRNIISTGVFVAFRECVDGTSCCLVLLSRPAVSSCCLVLLTRPAVSLCCLVLLSRPDDSC